MFCLLCFALFIVVHNLCSSFPWLKKNVFIIRHRRAYQPSDRPTNQPTDPSTHHVTNTDILLITHSDVEKKTINSKQDRIEKQTRKEQQNVCSRSPLLYSRNAHTIFVMHPILIAIQTLVLYKSKQKTTQRSRAKKGSNWFLLSSHLTSPVIAITIRQLYPKAEQCNLKIIFFIQTQQLTEISFVRIENKWSYFVCARAFCTEQYARKWI